MKLPGFKATLLCHLAITLQYFTKVLARCSNFYGVLNSNLELTSDWYVDVDLGLVLVVGLAVSELRRNL
jgi:hypothetical protein